MTSSPHTDVDPDARTRIRQQEVVAELGQRALETDDLDALMHDAAAGVAETLDNEYAKVLELRSGGDEVFLRQGVGWREGLVGDATVPTDLDSQAGYTLLSEEPIIVDDLRSEVRFSGPELLTSHDVVSGISVTIGSVENPWGVLGTHTTERREFTDHDATFVQSVANVLASAIEETTTKRRLREREAELEEVYGRVTDGFLAVSDDWEFTHVNERAETILGVDESDLHGRELWEVFPEVVGTEFEAHYREAMATQNPVSAEAFFEPLNKWFEERIHPSETGLSIYFRDVTEQKYLEAELEKTFDRITDAFIGLDREWEITYVNERGSELLDPENDGLVGRNFWDPFEPALETTFEHEYREAMDTQEATSFEEYYPPLDTWFEVHAYPSETGLSIYFRDVTERKEREAEFRMVADNLEEIIWIMAPDSMEYQYISPAFDDIWGVSRQVLYDDPSSYVQWVHPDDRERVRTNFEKLPDEPLDETFRIERPDGETRWLRVRGKRVETDDGISKVIGIGQDVTERKAYEHKLEESERLYRTLAEHFPNGAVGVYDRDLRQTLVAGEKIGGPLPPATDLEGRRFPEVYPEHVVEDVEPLLRAAIEDGETGSTESEFAGRHWRVWATPLRNDDGEIFAGLSFAQDITTEIERQRELEASNERLEQFAYAASHDLQEPLRMVSSYLKLLDSRYSENLDDDATEFLEFAVDGADRMRTMIDGLLEYARVDTQGDPLEPVDLDQLLEEVRDDLQMQIAENDAHITIEDLPRVEGDPSQLRQVFQNLFSNAITYSGDSSPTIHVEAERRDAHCTVSVRDEGVGIDPDDQERIFEVFQRLHSRGEYSGTGIGLALCQRIVERHGGRIWVDSEPGEGSTFSLTLPAADSQS